jgi:hypothetical protein
MESLSVHEQGPRFLIADDHAMFAEALRLYLEKAHPVVGIASHQQSRIVSVLPAAAYICPSLCQEQRSAAKRTATYSQSRHRRCA